MTGNEQGISRVQMGSSEEKQIRAELKRIEEIGKRKGRDFERLKAYLEKEGTYDISLKRAITFQVNMLEELRQLAKDDESFKKVYDYFKSIKNPQTFYEIAQRSQALEDFFNWYKNPESYAGFDNSTEVADYILKEYGIEIE